MMNVKNVINRNNKHSIQEDPKEGGFPQDGILRIQRPASRIEQENHNANHVLNYVALVSLSITYEIRRKAGPEAAMRMRAHLACLREFIEEADLDLSWAVTGLLRSLTASLPDSREGWICFIAGHHNEFQILSLRYGGLKNHEISKMQDLYEGRQWLRVWWWGSRLRKLQPRISKVFRCVTERFCKKGK